MPVRQEHFNSKCLEKEAISHFHESYVDYRQEGQEDQKKKKSEKFGDRAALLVCLG